MELNEQYSNFIVYGGLVIASFLLFKELGLDGIGGINLFGPALAGAGIYVFRTKYVHKDKLEAAPSRPYGPPEEKMFEEKYIRDEHGMPQKSYMPPRR